AEARVSVVLPGEQPAVGTAAQRPRPGPDRPRQTTPGRSVQVLLALLLIAVGATLLLARLVAPGGSAVLLALGVAFVVARLATGWTGFAVPAGPLLGLGGFVLLRHLALIDERGGWPFLLLGLGFVAMYLVAARLQAVWPLLPAVALVSVGLLLL